MVVSFIGEGYQSTQRDYSYFLYSLSSVCGVMVSLLASRAVDHGFESQSGQTKDWDIGMCYLSAKHTAL